MKSNKGFSLVELIVVIAIMAIIAGVAIPVYTNYIKKADDAVAVQTVADFAYAAELACIEFTSTVEVEVSESGLTAEFSDAKAAKQAAAVVGITLGDAVTTVELTLVLTEDGVEDAEEVLERLATYAPAVTPAVTPSVTPEA